MAQELIYTSAEHGLRLGTSGYCTVAHTTGMTPRTIQLLEAMSTYNSAYSLQQESEGLQTPVCWSHLRSSLLGHEVTVLSRISGTRADHTNRSNKIAHHLLIRQSDRPAGGPAWLCSQPEVFREAWDEPPHQIDTPRTLVQGDETDLTATAWKEVTGEAAHAWELAADFLASPARVTVLVYEPGMPMLLLLREALRLLPEQQRWQVTFSTYFTSLAAGNTCVWRGCLADSDVLRQLQRNPRVRTLDLTRPLPPVTDQSLLALCRNARPLGGLQETQPADTAASGVPFKLMRNRINQVSLRPRQ